MIRSTPKGWFGLFEFGCIPVLHALTDADSLKTDFGEPGPPSAPQFWLGYSLAVAVAVDRIIDNVLDHPERFGLRPTETIGRSYQGGATAPIPSCFEAGETHFCAGFVPETVQVRP